MIIISSLINSDIQSFVQSRKQRPSSSHQSQPTAGASSESPRTTPYSVRTNGSCRGTSHGSRSRSLSRLLPNAPLPLPLLLLALFFLICCCVPQPTNAAPSGLDAVAPIDRQERSESGVVVERSVVGEVAQPMKDANWLKGYEPSCDELRAMWRFSKRQSRAAEMTNEIPTYRNDPFALNMWQPAKPRLSKQSQGRSAARYMYDRSGKMMRNTARNGFGFPQFLGLGPVYGRVVHKEPELDFGYAVQPPSNAQRRVQYRFPGPSPGNNSPPANAVVARMSGSTQLNSTPQRGSFMKLKELVWTERARELANQRRTEEMAARAAVLKELANGGHGAPYPNGGQYYQNGGNGASGSNLDYNMAGLEGENGAGAMPDESSYYESGNVNGGGQKLSHFRERNSFLQQQQQQGSVSGGGGGGGQGTIKFPSKYSRLY